MAGRVGKNLQSTPAVTCMKILMTVFNFIFWVSGVAILALGVWMKLELYMYFELTESYHPEAPYVLIGVGAGIVLIGSLGCCCTVKGKSPLLYVYAVFLILIFIAELAVSISAFIYKGKLESQFESGLEKAMGKYGKDKDEEMTKVLDKLQQGLMCCGKEGYKDWYAIAWDGAAAAKVPMSCCKDEESCDNTKPGDIYQDGCNSLLSEFMQSNFNLIGGVAIGFSFLQLFGAIIACGLAKNINKSKYEQVA